MRDIFSVPFYDFLSLLLSLFNLLPHWFSKFVFLYFLKSFFIKFFSFCIIPSETYYSNFPSFFHSFILLLLHPTWTWTGWILNPTSSSSNLNLNRMNPLSYFSFIQPEPGQDESFIQLEPEQDEFYILLLLHPNWTWTGWILYPTFPSSNLNLNRMNPLSYFSFIQLEPE